MVNGNNVIANAHFKKNWMKRVRTWMNQPARKYRRRSARIAKAAAIAPRPVAGALRPAVRGQTIKYSTKVRAGRGFTLTELKEAGINRHVAQTIGIAVDHRRKNRSVDRLQANVQRLKEYQSKLLVFPRNSKKPKNGDSKPDQLAKASQLKGAVLPIRAASKREKARKITKEEAEGSAYREVRLARSDLRLWGIRKKRADDKAREEAEKKK
eukprot:TRINITY_DN269_c0_g1_i2.p1 TRINITY_DN269_c0_g1~~TRINITY_DN269_c0_g1_i2.p1  ORF type:complete len:211 (-),score=76.97 TRINITY_DN269_c0_g1_i2:156-788(-)